MDNRFYHQVFIAANWGRVALSAAPYVSIVLVSSALFVCFGLAFSAVKTNK